MRKTKKPKSITKKPWFVYILECQDSSFYIGTTNDPDKRMKTHAEGKGSKYVKHKKFKKLLATKQCANRSEACKAECEIRKLSKQNKLNYFKH